jgi:predicted ArsR family transcriptional regulator
MRTIVKVNAMSYAIMLKNMMEGDHSCFELAEITGLHVLTIYQYCRELHKQGVIHICRYEPNERGRHTIKVYKLGQGKDAKRIRMSGLERQAKHRSKIAAMQVAQVMAGKGEFIARANGRKLFQMLEAA